jgi:hypothetical protein
LVRQPEELKAADVPDLHPRRVRWYGEKLSEFYNALVEVPADDLSDDGAGESEVSNGND